MMDIKKIREAFPIYKQKPNLIYLDTTASALKSSKTIEALNNYYVNYGVNVHRGGYDLSCEATELYEKAREKVARFINAETDEIIFTRGTTTSLNMVAYSYLNKLKPGDEIITSELEHHSSFLPWKYISEQTGATLKFVELNENYDITLENFKKVLTKNTKVVALTYVSNVIGRITPIKEIVKLSKEVGAVTIIDAAQAAAHFKIDVKDLDCDFLAFSGHKMTGPTGVGALYIHKNVFDDVLPIEYGGEMVSHVSKDEIILKTGPAKFEAGTPIIAGAIGLGETVEFIDEIGLEKIHHHIKELYQYTIEKLNNIDGIKVYNPNSDTGIITFNIDDIHPHDAATIYDEKGVCIRPGKHCAHLIVEKMGVQSTLRTSLYIYNSKEDVDAFVKATIEIRDFFRRF